MTALQSISPAVRKASSSRRLAGVAALFALAGCANLIGLSDLEDEDEGLIVRGGSAGRGGTTGGGTAGSGGTTGGTGAVSGLEGCDGTPFEPNEDIVRSCILRNSCYPLEPDFTISACISYNLQNDLGAWSCTKTATSCEDVAQCLGGGWLLDGTCDEAATEAAYCESNQAINCDTSGGGLHFFRDCNVLGGTCDTRSDGSTACRVEDTCTGTETGCGGPDDNHLYACDDGKGFGFDCDTVAGTCDTEGATCVYSTLPCSGSEVECVGQTIDFCLEGDQRQYECGGVGLTCSVSAEADNGYCLAPGCTPEDELDCVESCAGTEMTLCYGGVAVAVDCTDYGFSECVVWTASDAAQSYLGVEYVSCL